MKMKELRQKTSPELKKLLVGLREKLRELRFKVALKQIKNHREIPALKKEIARILTILNEQAIINDKKNGK